MKQLPNAILDCLMEYEISQENILCFCGTDLSFEGRYVDGFVLLTASDLIVLREKKEIRKVRYFRGTEKNQSEEDLPYNKEFVVRVIALSKVENIFIERMIATNLLVVETEAGKERVATFTNLYLSDMNDFVRLYARWKELYGRNEEIPDSEREEKLKNLQSAWKAEVLEHAEEEELQERELYCPVCGKRYPEPERKVCPHCMNKRSVFGRAIRYYIQYPGKIVLLFLSYILTAGVGIVYPYLSGTVLYDYVLEKNDKALSVLGLGGKYVLALGVLALGIACSMLLQKLLYLLRATIEAILVSDVERDLKRDVFASLERLSIGFYTSKQTGSLMTRVLSDAERVTVFFLEGFPYIFVHGFTILASFVIMFRLDWRMALIACILLPLLVFLSVKLKPGLWNLFGRKHRATRSANAKVNDNLTGARVVRAFGQEDAEIQRFENPNERMREAEIRIVQYNNRFTILYNMVQEISKIWVWIFGVVMMLKYGSMEMGVLITFVEYVNQLNGPMGFFSRVFHMWSDSINAAERMFEIMDAIPDLVEAEDPVSLEEMNGEIELSNVVFGYDNNKPVLKNISLHVKPGEVLGIVGRSGAGKTTLVNLISRLYDVKEGKITIDGTDVRNVVLKDLRKNVAMVSQDTYLFMGTVADNIAYAKPGAGRREIVEAAMKASAHDFIVNLPDGYDTVIGEGGASLSGGEKQRISIARAIMKDSPVIFLDEATANVDPENENELTKAIHELTKEKTVIMIAHRLKTVREADRIFVIDQGRIIQSGRHDELMEQEGLYKSFVSDRREAASWKVHR